MMHVGCSRKPGVFGLFFFFCFRIDCANIILQYINFWEIQILKKKIIYIYILCIWHREADGLSMAGICCRDPLSAARPEEANLWAPEDQLVLR